MEPNSSDQKNLEQKLNALYCQTLAAFNDRENWNPQLKYEKTLGLLTELAENMQTHPDCYEHSLKMNDPENISVYKASIMAKGYVLEATVAGLAGEKSYVRLSQPLIKKDLMHEQSRSLLIKTEKAADIYKIMMENNESRTKGG